MRETSSSVLTSRSSRSPLRFTTSSSACGGGGEIRVALGEQFFDRAEHEGEGGAELVADVAEEGSLGPVQLGQCLGPLPLLLVGPCIGDGGGDLGGCPVPRSLGRRRRSQAGRSLR